jgi:hypothetical protein
MLRRNPVSCQYNIVFTTISNPFIVLLLNVLIKMAWVVVSFSFPSSSPFLLALSPHPSSSPFLLTLPPHPSSSPFLLAFLLTLPPRPSSSPFHLTLPSFSDSLSSSLCLCLSLSQIKNYKRKKGEIAKFRFVGTNG